MLIQSALAVLGDRRADGHFYTEEALEALTRQDPATVHVGPGIVRVVRLWREGDTVFMTMEVDRETEARIRALGPDHPLRPVISRP